MTTIAACINGWYRPDRKRKQGEEGTPVPSHALNCWPVTTIAACTSGWYRPDSRRKNGKEGAPVPCSPHELLAVDDYRRLHQRRVPA
ncbi:MAG: hypothetical protein ACRC7D_10995 [Aeromonas popoffii]|uniref:hypothetical protein n=1 Tax=Aeromonas popoffii TaxID=70856 RepID=UPI003F2B020D